MEELPIGLKLIVYSIVGGTFAGEWNKSALVPARPGEGAGQAFADGSPRELGED